MTDEAGVSERLTRIEGKLDLIALQHSNHTQISERTAADHEARIRAVEQVAPSAVDHEARLRTLERARWPLPSLAVLVSLASLVLALIMFARGGG